MARGLAVVAALVLAVSVLWLAGEQHKSNCIDTKRTGCSVLPWENGQAAKSEDWRKTNIWDEDR